MSSGRALINDQRVGPIALRKANFQPFRILAVNLSGLPGSLEEIARFAALPRSPIGVDMVAMG